MPFVASFGQSSEAKLLIAIGGIYICFITFAINTEVGWRREDSLFFL